MKIYLVRHGKSDKSLEGTMPHDEFEMKRPLIEGEAEKARQLGERLKEKLGDITGYDLVYSGKLRSKQTVLAIGEGLGLSPKAAQVNLREDSGLIYLTDKEYWHECEEGVKSGQYPSHADFFLHNPPKNDHTFSAEYMIENMRLALRRAIKRNGDMGNAVCVMVSHEPVISLFLSHLFGKSVSELGGSCKELEYAEISVNASSEKGRLSYRGFTKA